MLKQEELLGLIPFKATPDGPKPQTPELARLHRLLTYYKYSDTELLIMERAILAALPQPKEKKATARNG